MTDPIGDFVAEWWSTRKERRETRALLRRSAALSGRSPTPHHRDEPAPGAEFSSCRYCASHLLPDADVCWSCGRSRSDSTRTSNVVVVNPPDASPATAVPELSEHESDTGEHSALSPAPEEETPEKG